MSELLAKSPKNGHKVYLFDHTRHVMEAAETLFGKLKPSRLGECWLRFFKIEQNPWPIFHATLRSAAAFHDLGKVNDGFQKTVEGKGIQAIRHEHLSGLLMFHPPVWAFLQKVRGTDWDIALSSVLSHHLKVREGSLAALLQIGTNWSVKLPNQDYPDFNKILRLIHDADWPKIPVIWSFDDIRGAQSIPKGKKNLADYLEKLDESLSDTPVRANLLRAVRAALIAADAAASGLVREGHTIRQWIEDRFVPIGLCSMATTFVKRSLTGALLNSGIQWKGWHSFQLACRGTKFADTFAGPVRFRQDIGWAWKWIEKQATMRVPSIALFFSTPRAQRRRKAFAITSPGRRKEVWFMAPLVTNLKVCLKTRLTTGQKGITRRKLGCSPLRFGINAYFRQPSINFLDSCNTLTGPSAFCRFSRTP